MLGPILSLRQQVMSPSMRNFDALFLCFCDMVAVSVVIAVAMCFGIRLFGAKFITYLEDTALSRSMWNLVGIDGFPG
jgi:hypothetical protein